MHINIFIFRQYYAVPQIMYYVYMYTVYIYMYILKLNYVSSFEFHYIPSHMDICTYIHMLPHMYTCTCFHMYMPTSGVERAYRIC